MLHLFFFTCFLLLKMHYLDHILECPIGPSLKIVQLRRLFDWTNMAAALPQFFGAARHSCFEVSGYHPQSLILRLTHQFHETSFKKHWEGHSNGKVSTSQARPKIHVKMLFFFFHS